MMNFLQLFPILLLCTSSSYAWIGSHGLQRARNANSPLFAVQALSVEALDNHEEEGTLMAESLARWLDSEVSI
jgi:hypothetical protein